MIFEAGSEKSERGCFNPSHPFSENTTPRRPLTVWTELAHKGRYGAMGRGRGSGHW
jgi:hypothetical protein